uniref:Protein farnesyltransferase/geranylgeranyltransferase type-1 subunit alpha n=1 Tax=Compsopogon caeruleus TaxID=31354 RepID=A0A7S1T5G2_9RHOD|mmetsp:Transcript_10378/g.20926  ORF Transcript_10378/g.20926 Transcript_10378/m.20926 type:complete len:278 (+) Transcript_10378:85-918(+)
MSWALKLERSKDFLYVMGLLRFIAAGSERSDRVLKLTSQAIQLNILDYTAWEVRREVLLALTDSNGVLGHSELEFVATCANRDSKNYQLWHHRRFVVQHLLNDPSKELAWVDGILQDVDAKNYHAWSHRQWVVLEWDLYDGELEWTTGMLERDLRNNSAWNHRYLVASRESLEHYITFAESEIKFALDMIDRVPSNESAWNYLLAIVRATRSWVLARERVERLAREPFNCRFAKVYLMWCWSMTDGDNSHLIQQAAASLSEQDTIRAEFWKTFRGPM